MTLYFPVDTEVETQAKNGSAEISTQHEEEENRTRIAECKLDRLKSRFDKIYDDLEESRNELGQQQPVVEHLTAEQHRHLALDGHPAQFGTHRVGVAGPEELHGVPLFRG